MPKDNENVPFTISTPDETTESSGPQAFAPHQMVRCDECLRANPPTRVNCLYCAAVLPLNETTIDLQKPPLRPLEKWEQGYNNILLPRPANPPGPNPGEGELAEAADLLRLDAADLIRILSLGVPLPLARAASIDEASLVQRRLTRLGIDTRIVSDEELGIDERGPIRVRGLEIGDCGVSAYQTRETQSIQIRWPELVLLVTGRLILKRVELKEQKGARAENRILDASEFFTDESVVDLYTTSQIKPFRIAANSFDFSCLGRGKGLLAGENLSLLIKLFGNYAPHAALDDSYNSARKSLEAVWPSEQKNESGGWRRERPGKYSIGSATQVSNETQFSRYSRLRFYFQSEANTRTNENA